MIIKKTIVAISMLAALAASSSAVYAGTNPYSDCGVGQAVFQKTSWAATTSNITWDLGSTAITSATSSPKTCTSQQLAAARFIDVSYEKLAEETAAGQGEHLNTVLNILQCDAARHSGAIKDVRNAMSGVVAMPNYVDMVQSKRQFGFTPSLRAPSETVALLEANPAAY